MLRDQFSELVRLSGTLRPAYPGSLGVADPQHRQKILTFWPDEFPPLIDAIYSTVRGTRRGIRDQKLMDFLPGYRLIHIDELASCFAALAKQVPKPRLFPFLANYSSDYICVDGKKVSDVTHDELEIAVLHKTPHKFLETICEFYRRKIYRLDRDGFLDYDQDGEGECGAELNPGVGYWFE